MLVWRMAWRWDWSVEGDGGEVGSEEEGLGKVGREA